VGITPLVGLVVEMSLTVQQLLNDAKRLSSRLRDHDQSADHLIARAQEVLKEVDAMRQYQEDVENLNEVAHNRPRAQLVLGIQQENRHIRTLQQENKELRAALEEHQNALELIMSKYRQHVTKLVNAPNPDFTNINQLKIQALAERTEKVCEMAAVMKEAVRVDEAACNQQQETVVRLVTENKGLRELLEISQRSLSTPVQRTKRPAPSIHKEVQTENVGEEVEVVTLPRPGAARAALPKSLPTPGPNMHEEETGRTSAADVSSGDSDETGSEDESIKFDTIQRASSRRKTMVEKEKREKDGVVEKLVEEMVIKSMEKEKVEPSEALKIEGVGKEPSGVVERVVEQLVSDTIDNSSPAQSADSCKDVRSPPVLNEADKRLTSDSTNPCSEPKILEHEAARESITTSETKIDQTEVGENANDSLEAATVGSITQSEEKSEESVVSESDKITLDQNVTSESKGSDPTEDSPNAGVEKNDASSDVSKAPASNHNRSNSRGKKGKGERNSPKKKKPNS